MSVILRYASMAAETFYEQTNRPMTVSGVEGGPTIVRDPMHVSLPRSWSSRLESGTSIIHRAFSPLLAGVVLLSLPIAHTCQASFTIEVPCLTNAATTTTVILAWIYTAMSILWWFLELLSWGHAKSGVGQFIVGIASYPFIIAIFFVAIRRWAEITSHNDQ
ncbi:hypothetical protein HDU76_011081 [Blyttiomyces sp. JEL0837]|nr:hypothetical protein HDU76_011081 [Blyttiomyces sp. JEL0837]